jgi:DNA-binding transcriptional ArsR family regulator
MSPAMNATLTALAEPNRLQIVELLLGGPRPVGDIVETLRLRQPQVSKHLRVLSDAGLVAVRPAAQRRIYSLKPQAFMEMDAWLESYRSLWEERFDRFDKALQELKDHDKDREKET